jgi:hypothetical protein
MRERRCGWMEGRAGRGEGGDQIVRWEGALQHPGVRSPAELRGRGAGDGGPRVPAPIRACKGQISIKKGVARVAWSVALV